MKQEVKKLIAAGNIEKALELLATVDTDVLLLQAQFNNGKKTFNMGLIEHSEWQRICARVTYSALEICGKIPDNVSVAQPSLTTKTDNNNSMDNSLTQAEEVFDKIQRDLKNLDYNVNKLQNYCQILDNCTNSSIFGNLMDFIKLAEWKSLLTAQKLEKVKTMLETILSKKDSVLKRLTQFVAKGNSEIKLNDALQAFKEKPNPSNWSLIYTLLFERFSDATLFDPKVQQAWFKWDDKFSGLKTELDWAFDYKGSSDETDLWNFIKVNSQIKNFNYN